MKHALLKLFFCITVSVSCTAHNTIASVDKNEPSSKSNAPYPENKLTIIGGGIVGAFQAYYAYQDACKKQTRVRVTIHEKNKDITGTTTLHIVPSLTPDEILSVVPRGKELVKKLQILFNQPGGLRINDIAHINDSPSALNFIKQVEMYSQDQEGYKKRTHALLSLGKMSMELWQKMYDEADPALKAILIESNFNPCREPRKEEGPVLHGWLSH